jgi:hypothetical protein
MTNFAIDDMASRPRNLKPLHMVNCRVGAADGILDFTLNAGGRGPDDFDFAINAIGF